MESIFTSNIWKSSSQGGPQHSALGGTIGFIVQRYIVLSKVDIICLSQGLWSILKSQSHSFFALESFYSRKGKRPKEQAFQWRQLGVGSARIVFLSLSCPIQRSLFGNPLCLIVPGNCFEVSFQSKISLSGRQKYKMKTSPLSGFWLPGVSHFYNMSYARMFLF